MSAELLPCPHCGGTAFAYRRTCEKNTPYDARDTAFPIVRCGMCFATSPGKDWSSPETAIIAWNTRTKAEPDPILAQMAEALRFCVSAMDDARDAIQPITKAQMTLHNLNPMTAYNLDFAAKKAIELFNAYDARSKP